MSENQIGTRITELLSQINEDEEFIIQQVDKLIKFYGTQQVESWETSPMQNSFLHELVEKGWLNVVRHVIEKYEMNINIKRQSDGSTPYQLAQTNQNSEMSDLLLELGAETTLTNDNEDEELEAKNNQGNSMNIIWLDLEMTSLEDPYILECAVIITDKHLNELERGEWVIHFEQSLLSTLGDWHQNQFKDRELGGNGLFSEVVKSKLTKDEVEDQLLQLIQRHCPDKMCSLAGSSIHIDKEVLKLRMPKVHNYLHYRIIDVSSFRAMMKRWAPRIEAKFVKQLSTHGQEMVNHRAMDDIEWSIALMRLFRPLLTGKWNANRIEKKPWVNHHNRSASEGPIRRHGEQAIISNRPDRSELYADEKSLLKRLHFEEKHDPKYLNLNKRDQGIYNRNPHLREVFINHQRLQFYEQDFTRENRLLKRSHGQYPVIRGDTEKVNTTEHWGQRKLLLTEIEFLTNYATNGQYLVIYAGAAPGLHVEYLSSLFPNLEFALIDSKEFAVTGTDQIHIIPTNFTEDLAKQYSQSKQRKLFICNVHTFQSRDSSQDDVIEDNFNQMTWHRLLQPHASLLNFRLPRADGKISYFEGDLVIEPWASKRSVECRLVVQKDARMIGYEYTKFEQDMLYFHHVTRTTYYKHYMDDIKTEGLDNCYDCRAEIFILQEYLTKCQNIYDLIGLKQATAEMSATISRRIEDKTRRSVIKMSRTLDIIPKK